MQRHFQQTLAYIPVQRLAKIRKCRITANEILQVHGETFCKKAIAVWEKHMSQFVHNGRFARSDPPRWKFHISGAARPGRHKRFGYTVSAGNDYFQFWSRKLNPIHIGCPFLKVSDFLTNVVFKLNPLGLCQRSGSVACTFKLKINLFNSVVAVGPRLDGLFD